MGKPCGLLVTLGSIEAEQVKEALDEQGGPSWDRTVFRLLADVDVRSLLLGKPEGGSGTAISLASTGWWFRNIDEFAERLSKLSGSDVLALVSADEVSGYHLARPEGVPGRELTLGDRFGWFAGASELLAEDLSNQTAPDLTAVAFEVHGDDPVGADLPGLFNLAITDDSELQALTQLKGAALSSGCAWRPLTERDPEEPVPDSMRGLILASAVRLPGPPRCARATRANAIRRAEKVVRTDGWLCLVPQEDGKLLKYGTAVRILQLAPMSDGSALGLIHPRAAVRVGATDGSIVSIEVIEAIPASDPKGLAASVEAALELLPGASDPVVWDAEELRSSDDPAQLLAWQIDVNPDQCQRYLADGDAGSRMAILVEALKACQTSG